MKANVSLVVVALGACTGKSGGLSHDEGNAGRPGWGGSVPGATGGSGGIAASGGRGPSGGVSACGATAAGAEPRSGGAGEGGTRVAGGTAGAGGLVATGGSTMGGWSGVPPEAGSSGTAAGSSGEADTSAGEGGAGPILIEGGPCDIYAFGNTPCVAAYSTVRALSDAYDGPLYQVRRADGETKDIGLLAAGSFANAAEQDTFCQEEACTISIIYDQSGQGNHLTKAPMDCYQGTASDPSNESDAKGRALEVGGHDVYALQMIAKDGYRDNQTSGMPTGGDAQGIYEVVDGKRFGSGCCWDFGNGTTDNCLGSPGSANALFFGTAYWGTGAGDGPWFMADFQPGVWAGGDGASTVQNPALPSANSDYAFGILKTRKASYTIRVGNAHSGGLTTAYDGAAPVTFVMQGAVILGLSSDASDASYGTFFEGAITNGRPSNAVDDAVLRNVQVAGYGK
jgi:hypothetical protein